MSERSRLIARYRDFARAAAGQSDCFVEWALGVAGDPEVLAWVGTLPRPKQQPNLVFAAVRWHGIPAPGPYADLRQALLGDDGTIRNTIMTRATQTNEVGRLATLMPVFSLLNRESERRPLALLEVGASAGLCLYPDRYDYDWDPAGRLAGSGGPVLRCPVEGPMPLPGGRLRIGWRAGIDLNPIDVTDEESVAWLETLVWPEQTVRRNRLRAAVEIARDEPPELLAGDLLQLLPAAVERASRRGRVVVFHSAVIAYLDPSGRSVFQATMTDLVESGACHWVSNEDPRVLPEITARAGPVPSEPYFSLALDGRPSAWAHQHGAGLIWL